MKEETSQHINSNAHQHTHTNCTSLWFVCAFFLVQCCLFSCHEKVEHIAEAVSPTDTLPFMHAKGINTLISDSGVMRYRMVAEEWEIYNTGKTPATWKFMKGLLMERFDENFHVDLYIQSDTAYLHNQRIWELRGRVAIRNVRNEVFLTEELFWDMNKHEIWNHAFMRIITPERELQGTEFRSNERMTRYSVSNSKGAFPVSDTEMGGAPADTVVVPIPTTPEEMQKDEKNTTSPETTPLIKSAETENTRTPAPIRGAEKAAIAKPAIGAQKATSEQPATNKPSTPISLEKRK